MSHTITVACCCPPDGSRHSAGEQVTFREHLDFRTLALARKSLALVQHEDPDSGEAEFLVALEEFYLLHCIASWTLRDAKGKAIEVSKPAVREHVLPRTEVAFRLADYASGLYDDVLLAPLVAMASSSSAPMPTNGSISATSGSGPRPKRSRPSSTASTPMVATAAT